MLDIDLPQDPEQTRSKVDKQQTPAENAPQAIMLVIVWFEPVNRSPAVWGTIYLASKVRGG